MFFTGHLEFSFLKGLAPHFKSLCSVAVEPNDDMVDTFKRNVSSCDAMNTLTAHWFAGTFEDFCATSPLARRKFNLITAFHSIYHMKGDLEDTLTQLVDMLKENGVIFVFVTTGNTKLSIFWMFPWQLIKLRTLGFTASEKNTLIVLKKT